MAKDPAFLFYPQDFLTGTMFMSNDQVGIYIRLLCAQHQHGGLIQKTAFESIVGEHKIIREKFIETDDGFFQKRMMEEMQKRKAKSCNLSANAMQRWENERERLCKCNAIALHRDMPHEDEDEDENEDVIKDVKITEKNDLESCILHWNVLAEQFGLAKIIKLSEKRRAGIRARLHEKEFDLIMIEQEIAQSDFLRGSTGWKVDFDFVFCSANNYLKILEGKYRNGTNQSGNRQGIKKSGAGGATTEDDLRSTHDAVIRNIESQREREKQARSN